ncbi:MAG: Rrf2 family transcriptional regulator [Acidobacteriota bacterium]
MMFTKSTRYALYAALEMAAAPAGAQVTVAQVARKYRIPEGPLAKVFQRLVRSGHAVGTRGLRGGYQLAKAASVVTVLDVVSVFQPPRPPGQCLVADASGGGCDRSLSCRLRILFDEVDEVVRCTFASVTLETLAGRGTVRVLDVLSARPVS